MYDDDQQAAWEQTVAAEQAQAEENKTMNMIEQKPPHVLVAMNAVSTAMASQGIDKARSNAAQGFKFRGIDDCLNSLAPLFAKEKLLMLPRVVSRHVQDRQTAKGGTLIYTVLEVEFDFVSSVDGSKITIRTIGEAMDSGDKSSNKSMSAAYKYAVIQAFCIPTEGMLDADQETHQVAPAITTLAVETINHHIEEMAKPKDLATLKTVYAAAVKEARAAKDTSAEILFGYLKDRMKHSIDAAINQPKESANG